MKKLIICLLILTMLLAGCGTEPTEAPTAAYTEESTELPAEAPTEDPYAPIGDENTFLLPALPDIGKYEADKVKRWRDGPMPELIPSDEYGQLYPYLGAVREYSADTDFYGYRERTVNYYGLCTAEGVLVTDPVYTSVYCIDGEYLLVREYADASDIHTHAFVAASDGSYVKEIFHGAGIIERHGPDIYAVTNGHYSGRQLPEYYMHADGTHYDMDKRGFIEYVDGFLLFQEQPHRGQSDDLRLLDKDLQPIGDYIYLSHGAPGQIICKSGKGFVLLDESGRELYSTDSRLFYDSGRYMIKTDDYTITFLDEGFEGEMTVTYPSKIHGVKGGYVNCYENGRVLYYTFSGEKSDYTLIKQCEMSGAYLLQDDSGTLIKDGGEEYFFEGKKVEYGGIYGDVVAVRFVQDYNYYLYDREDGSLIAELSGFNKVGCRLKENLYYSYVRPDSGSCAYRVHNGVYTTLTPDGKVLVKLHSDTE